MRFKNYKINKGDEMEERTKALFDAMGAIGASDADIKNSENFLLKALNPQNEEDYAYGQFMKEKFGTGAKELLGSDKKLSEDEYATDIYKTFKQLLKEDDFKKYQSTSAQTKEIEQDYTGLKPGDAKVIALFKNHGVNAHMAAGMCIDKMFNSWKQKNPLGYENGEISPLNQHFKDQADPALIAHNVATMAPEMIASDQALAPTLTQQCTA